MKIKHLILLLVLIFLLVGLRNAGTYLVKESEVESADAGLILMGSIADRVVTGAEVFREGRVGELLIVNNVQYGQEFLREYGVSIPNFAELSMEALLQLEVPDSLISVIPGAAKSTQEEAEIAGNYLRAHPTIDTLMIISSAAHTRRAHLIFNKQFRKMGVEVEVVTMPSPYSGFEAKQWYSDRESAKQVFMEYVKISSFLLVEQWK